MNKKFIKLLVLTICNVIYFTSSIAKANSEEIVIRENSPLLFGLSFGYPEFSSIKVLRNFSSLFSLGIQGGLFPNIFGVGAPLASGFLDARFYLANFSNTNSLYTESQVGFIGAENFAFAFSQKLGFEIRNQNGFSFNFALGLSTNKTLNWNINPAGEVLIGYSF